MAQIPTSNITMAAIDTEVNGSTSSNRSLKTLHTNSIAYTGGNATAVTNNTKADPDSIKEFAGYVHTQNQSLTYTQNARHSSTLDAFRQDSTDVYSYYGSNMTYYRIKITWSTVTGKYIISLGRMNGTTNGFYTNNTSTTISGSNYFTIGTVQVPTTYTVNNPSRMILNHSADNWTTSYVDMYPSAGAYISIFGQTDLTNYLNTSTGTNGNSVTYGVGHRYSGFKEEGSSSTHTRYDTYSLTFERPGYYDYTTPSFKVRTQHVYIRSSGFFCLHEDMAVWVEGKDSLDFTPVKEVKVGDMVRTKDGRYTKVTEVITNHMREGYYKLFDGLKITGDHPIIPPGGDTQITPENPWTRVDELPVEKEYIEGTIPTVYIETEAGHINTYWKQPNNNDRWEGCLVSANYKKEYEK